MPGLRACLDEYESVLGGLVVHGGTEVYRLSERIAAASWWRVL